MSHLWSADGRHLVYDRMGPISNDVMVFDLDSGLERIGLPAAGSRGYLSAQCSPLGSSVIIEASGPTDGQLVIADLGFRTLIAPVGAFRVGEESRFRIKAPAGHESDNYRVLLSGGDSPGVETPAGSIPLQLDGLFILSLLEPPDIFRQFSGRLVQGMADAYLRVPAVPGLRGIRVFAGYVLLTASNQITFISGSRALHFH
jgi:hypothetical protein